MRKIAFPAIRTLPGILAFVLCALPMHGQTANTGAVAGTVIDPSGALVPRAAVVVIGQATGEERDLTTDAQGFSVPFLTPGNYDLTVRAPGFEPLILKNVQVQITEVSRLKIQLTISGEKKQITLSFDRRRTGLLPSESVSSSYPSWICDRRSCSTSVSFGGRLAAFFFAIV